MEVRGNSSHPVVGCRCDWDRLLKGVETVTAASFQDGWKALLAIDALLFLDLNGGKSILKNVLVADRIQLCEQGH